MRDVTIAFLGQCHTTGYPGVSRTDIFPQVARRALQAARPDVSVRLVSATFYHPADLPRAARQALTARPDVIVIEVVGWLMARGRESADLSRLPAAVRSTYDRARHFRTMTSKLQDRWPAGAALIARVETSAVALADSPLRSLLPRLPRATMAEYEAALDTTLADIRKVGDSRVVLQGPGVFSEDLERRQMAADSPKIYRQVNTMARSVATRQGALFVDRFDEGLVKQGTFYQPGSLRPSGEGHRIWGLLLAEQLLHAGLV